MLTQLSIRHRLPQIEVAVADNTVALVLRVLDAPSADDLARLREFAQTHSVRFYLQPGGLNSVQPLPAADAVSAASVSGPTSVSAPTSATNSSTAAAAPQPGDAAGPLRYGLPAFGLQLEFTPTDFVQINGAVNEALVSRAVDLLQLTESSVVLDLYCGIGNFTLALAKRAGRVVGVEGDHALVDRARHNARLNGITNAEFHMADLAHPDTDAAWLREPYTHVLLDPPRAGASEMLPAIGRLQPAKVLYISCHPGSLARDVGLLVQSHGFALRAAGVLDMFPHTTHVESLALLEPAAGLRGRRHQGEGGSGRQGE
jgi:23S rRNA (uracil1939-C5)-methyltransferase